MARGRARPRAELPLNERAVIVITVTSTVMNAAQNAAAEARAAAARIAAVT
jgi:hypothetical protein